MHGRFTVSGRCITTPEVDTRTGLLQSHISQVGVCVATPLQIVKSNGRVYQKNMTLFKTDPLKSILVEGLSNLQSLKSLYVLRIQITIQTILPAFYCILCM